MVIQDPLSAVSRKRFIFDIETDSLTPTVVWCAVFRDLDTQKVHRLTRPDRNRKKLKELLDQATLLVGHNVIAFDVPALERLCGVSVNRGIVVDTLILSQLDQYQREGGHSLENWGVLLGCPKGGFTDFSRLSFEMLDYCEQDTAVTRKAYLYLWDRLKGSHWQKSIALEHETQWLCNSITQNGFGFNFSVAKEIQTELQAKLLVLDDKIAKSFKPKSIETETTTPKAKKDGTVSSVGLRWYEGDIQELTPGVQFSRLIFEPFNPGSPKQIVERLNEAGWKPFDKTKTHQEWVRKRPRNKVESQERKQKLEHFAVYGWKVSEDNLATLPETAPEGARLMVERILVASRLRTLTEWFESYSEKTLSVHGTYLPLGTWTQRKSHRAPNMANIAAEKSLKYSSEKLSNMAKDLGKRMRSLWVARAGRVLVGTDAEGIQLRVLAHYLKSDELVEAITKGRKEDRTDIHSVNQRNLGEVCKSRDSAKTFIYAFLLGAGIDRIANILQCSRADAEDAYNRFIASTKGLRELREDIIPRDARRGFFVGFDGRQVPCDSSHKMLAGYLQNGESVVMKLSCLKWNRDASDIPFWLVNDVHDEWQTETLLPFAPYLGELQASSIEWAGRELGVYCPLAGDYSIGSNWYETH